MGVTVGLFSDPFYLSALVYSQSPLIFALFGTKEWPFPVYCLKICISIKQASTLSKQRCFLQEVADVRGLAHKAVWGLYLEEQSPSGALGLRALAKSHCLFYDFPGGGRSQAFCICSNAFVPLSPGRESLLMSPRLFPCAETAASSLGSMHVGTRAHCTILFFFF